jgi:hypothetical protein
MNGILLRFLDTVQAAHVAFLDKHCLTLREKLHRSFETIGLAA